MDPRIGVIPSTNAGVVFVEISLNQVLAVGILHSVYLFDTKEGENLTRINHFPDIVLAAAWHPERFSIVTADSKGELLETCLPCSTESKITVKPGLISMSFNISTGYLFVLYKDSVLVINKAYQQVSELLTGGFKLVLDYFSPWKLILLYEKGIKCVNDFTMNQIRKGKLKKVVDASKNPSALNSLFILTESQLLDYDTYSLRTSRVLNTFCQKMTRILSSFSSEVWVCSESSIISPINSVIPLGPHQLETLQVFPGSWTFDDQLSVCLLRPGLELHYGLLSSNLQITSMVQLGINLKLWNFAVIDEKVLVCYSSPFIFCFSFTKERVVRKIKAGEVTGLTCALEYCFFIEDNQHVVEWKLNSGEMKIVQRYEDKVESILVNKQATFLAVASAEFVDIFTLKKPSEGFQKIPIAQVSVMSWSDDDCFLYVCTSSQVIKIISTGKTLFEAEVLVTAQLTVSEIIEVSGELFIENNKSWYKFLPSGKLVPELIEKVDEINIGSSKAEFKDFGLLYRDQSKKSQRIWTPSKSCDYSNFFSSILKSHSRPSLTDLLRYASLSNNSKHQLFWRITQEMIENPVEDPDESIQDKSRPLAKDRSLYSSPGNITPTRRPVKRSISPLNKSRKSITPSRIQKLQSDPKDLIQLAVDTSSLLSSTQNFAKDPEPKVFYILDQRPALKGTVSSPSDFLTNDKKSLIKKLLASPDEKDMLLGCIIAGTLGRQELQKAIEGSCQKLSGFSGVVLNLANGSRGKAFELLSMENCYEEVAYCSKVTGKFDEFFSFVIKLYESGFKFLCAVHLFFTGYTILAYQVLCKEGEEELVVLLHKLLEISKSRKEVPAEFENWFYELGPPRFRSRLDDEISRLSEPFLNN